MEPFFKLAESLVHEINETLLQNRESIGEYSFTHALIKNNYFEIVFEGRSVISISLSTHPLDIPWTMVIRLTKDNRNFSLNDWKKVHNQNDTYEVNPNFFRNPEKIYKEFSKNLSDDLLKFLTEKIKLI